MRALITAIALAVLTLPAFFQPAAAQQRQVCKPREEIVKILGEKYQESRRAFALPSPQQILELFAAESGSWTALITLPDGISCILAAGTAWTEVEAAAGPKA